MPACYVIDEASRTVFSCACGSFTFSDCMGHMDRLLADPRFNPDYNQIYDFSDVTELSITPEQIHQLAKRHVFSAKSRRAYVVSSDLHFGMSRMYSSLRESEGEPGIITFRDLPSAVIWTNVAAAAAQKAFAELRQQCQTA